MNDNDFATNLGNRIRELRKNKGVSQLELAYDMDMSMNTISGIELGKISPKIDTLKKIAQKLDIDISELFDFSEHALISPAYEICTFFVNRTYLKKGRPAQNETQYTHTPHLFGRPFL